MEKERLTAQGSSSPSKACFSFLSFFHFNEELIINTSYRESEDEVSEEEEQLPSDEASENEGSGSEDEQEQATSRPYFALMQSLSKEPSAPSAKRRKLDTQSEEVKSSKLNQNEATASDEDEERDIDHVEEAEEAPENEIETDDDDDEDIPDSSDPFETHFVNPDQNEVQNRIKAIQNNEYSQSHSEKNGWRLIRNFPGKDIAQPTALPPPIPGPSSLNLKHRLAETASRKRPTFDKLEQVLYPLAFAYNDILFCGRTPRNAENLRRMACLHSVNHVFKYVFLEYLLELWFTNENSELEIESSRTMLN